MGKLKELIRKKRATRTIQRLSKEAVVLKNNYTTQYEIEGPRTFGYLDMWTALNAAFDLVYPKGFMGKYVYGVVFTETLSVITVHIFTPRPGILIGKAGNDIDYLKETLQKCFDKKTEIDLQETGLHIGMRFEENY